METDSVARALADEMGWTDGSHEPLCSVWNLTVSHMTPHTLERSIDGERMEAAALHLGDGSYLIRLPGEMWDATDTEGRTPDGWQVLPE